MGHDLNAENKIFSKIIIFYLFDLEPVSAHSGHVSDAENLREVAVLVHCHVPQVQRSCKFRPKMVHHISIYKKEIISFIFLKMLLAVALFEKKTITF